MKNLSSILGMGKKDTNDYDKYYRDDDDIYGDTEENDEDTATYAAEKKNDGVAFNASSAPVSLKVVKPKSYADGPSIADHLSQGSTVVLNIESLDRAGAIRLIDFLMGAIHVLGGDMKSVTKTTLVFAPRNVGVSEFENIEEDDAPLSDEE